MPPTLRDILLCLAERDLFQPAWQEEIEIEVIRNGARLLVERSGLDAGDAAAKIHRTVGFMNKAFPAARLDRACWVPLVDTMTNDPKDRHVLAAAIGGGATHLVTSNVSDFPPVSVPDTIELIDPEAFLLRSFEANQGETLAALTAMAEARSTPPVDLAQRFANGQLAPRFGKAIAAEL